MYVSTTVHSKGSQASQRLTSFKGYLDSIFPTQLVWLSSVFLFLGGGTRVFNSMIFTLVSDCLGHSQR